MFRTKNQAGELGGIHIVSDRSIYLTNLLLVALGALSLAVTLLVGIGYATGSYDLIAITVILLIDLIIASGWWLMRRGHWQVVAWMAVVLFVGLGVYGTAQNGLVTNTILFYATAVLTAGMLLGRRLQWLVLAVCLLIYSWLGFSVDASNPVAENMGTLIVFAITLAAAAYLQQLSNGQLQVTENLYRSLFEDNHSVMLLVDPVTTRIIDANQAATDFYRYSKDQLLQMSIPDLLAMEEGQARALLASMPPEASGRRQVPHRLSNGEVRDVEIYYGPFNLNKRRGRYAIVMDVTERLLREKELEAVAGVAATLRAATTRQEVLDLLLGHLMATFEAQGAAVVTWEGEGEEPRFTHRIGQFDSITEFHHQEAGDISLMVIRNNKPFIYNPLEEHAGSPDAHPLPLAGAPLRVDELANEAVWVARSRPFSDKDMRLLSALAEMAAGTLRRASLHEQTERHLQHLNALHTVEMAILGSTDVPGTLRVLLQQVMDQLGIDAADVLLYEAATMTLVYAASRGFHYENQREPNQRLGRGLAGLVALERRTMHIRHLSQLSLDHNPATGRWNQEGFVTYFGLPLIAKGEVKGVLELFHRTELNPDPEWFNLLEILAGSAAIAIDNATLFDGLQRVNLELTLAYDTTLEGWARALELRDKETEGHSQRVTRMSVELARRLGYDGESLVHIRRGALLHDIGKMGIPDEILQKPGTLSDTEWEVMRQHPVYAYRLLAPIEFLRPALDIPHFHHERWNGSGYPLGLREATIPVSARLFAVVDVWDALRSHRPYRPAWDEDRVVAYLSENAGIQFDPQIMEVFLAMLGERDWFKTGIPANEKEPQIHPDKVMLQVRENLRLS